MDYNIIVEIAKVGNYTDKQIEGLLTGICDDLHSNDCRSCPMVEMELVKIDENYKFSSDLFKDEKGNCPFHKFGRRMLEAIRYHG